jgi:hypothetical protein
MTTRKKAISLILPFLIIALLASSLFYFKPDTQSANGQTETWYNSNWSSRRSIKLTENSNTSLVNFPVQVAFEHDGKAKAAGEDIRVVIGGVEVPSYVLETNNTYATVVFEINLTAASTKIIYVYYGNPQAFNPSYELTPLTVSEGQKGYAIIDNSVYVGWDYTSWGWSE